MKHTASRGQKSRARRKQGAATRKHREPMKQLNWLDTQGYRAERERKRLARKLAFP